MFDYISNKIFPDKNDIIYKICKTTRVKKILNSALIVIITIILRLLLYSALSIIIVFNNLYIDFCVQCVLSIYLCTINQCIQDKIEIFEPMIYNITRYVVNNYSNEKFKKWKIYSILLLLLLSYIYFSFVDITSALIKIYLIQYAICFLFLELYNNPNELKNLYCSLLYKKINTGDMIVVDKSIYEPGIDGFIDIQTIKIDQKKHNKNKARNDDNIDITKKILYTSISDEFIIVDK
jgi:hypothetical protein